MPQPRDLFALRTAASVLTAAICSFGTTNAFAAPKNTSTTQASTAARTHDITADDYFSIAHIASCAVSPDGLMVAYTEMRWNKELDNRTSELWVVRSGSGARTRLTFNNVSESAPTWSPDSKWIYFTGALQVPGEDQAPNNGATQVWRVDPSGENQPTAVTRETDGIEDFQFSADGNTLYYTTSREHVDNDDWKPLRKEFKDLNYGHGVRELSTLYALDLESWRTETLLEPDKVIAEFAASPDGRYLALRTTPDRHLITNEGWSEIEILDRTTGTITVLPSKLWRDDAPSPYGWLLGLAWADDSRALAFRVDFDGYPGEGFVAEFNEDGHTKTQRLARHGDINLEGGTMYWLPDSRDLSFLAEDHARARIYCIRNIKNGAHGEASVLTPGDVAVSTYHIGKSGRMAVVMPTLTTPPDIYIVQDTPNDANRYQRITHANPQVDTWKLPQIEIVSWTAPDGEIIEGILELPPGYKKSDGPLPTLVELHGGPTSSTRYCFQYWIYGRTLFAAKGWAMFSPNYRGSTGYGDKFLIALVGRENNIEVKDILAGVDALVAQGIADPDRLGVMGWSNGGYLTNALITNTDRFKAAGSGAGVFDMTYQWMVEDTPGHVINYAKGQPWERAEHYQEMSPLFDADKITTPTLIHMGEGDPRVPVGHAQALHRALKHYLHVPVELVIYPNAGHGLRTYTHRKAKLDWDHAWFDRWVLGKNPPTGETATDTE